MRQNVHNVSYLAVTILNLATIQDESYPAVALPSGAEVLSVSVEVKEEADAGTTLKVGLASEAEFLQTTLTLQLKGIIQAQKRIKCKAQEQLM